MGIRDKQTILENGTVVATIGFTKVGDRFCQMAKERASFDEMVAMAPEMFAEDRRNYHPLTKELNCGIVFAGWSEESARTKLHIILSRKEGHADFDAGTSAWAGGPPGVNCAELVTSFSKRFNANPKAFDAHRDGLKLIEQLRHQFSPPSVGGFVRHTIVRRGEVKSEIIYRWPSDRVGHPLDLKSPGQRPLPADILDFLRRTNPTLAAKHEAASK